MTSPEGQGSSSEHGTRRPAHRRRLPSSGASRKALPIYEAAGILPPSRWTLSGYRLYTAESLAVLSFLTQAQRLGFTLGGIKRIVAIRRQGRSSCSHVRELVFRKDQEMDQRLKESDRRPQRPAGHAGRLSARRRGQFEDLPGSRCCPVPQAAANLMSLPGV